MKETRGDDFLVTPLEVGDTGFEVPSDYPKKTGISEPGDVESDVNREVEPKMSQVIRDPGLSIVATAWPSLPLVDRTAILAIVRKASAGEGRS